MISYLSGTTLFVRDTYLVLEVRGVGYKIHCTQQTLDAARTTPDLALHTHLAVREDAMELFGFLRSEELSLFELLIGVSGIGPRSALGVIGLDTTEKLVGAIAHGDVAYLTKVSGVGKKSAEKIVLELRDKVGALHLESVEQTRSEDSDVLEALQALGYRMEDAREALRHIPGEVAETSARITEALRRLSGMRN